MSMHIPLAKLSPLWTGAMLDALKSPKGGYTRETLARFCVPWPPPKGWRKTLIGTPVKAPRK